MKTLTLATAPVSLFWYWMNERHSIYLRRQRGEPKPWTEDPILRDYKFTNVFRELDRGTVWLRENFLKPHRDDDLGLLAFNICWYRMFNWWGTGLHLGWQTPDTWRPANVKNYLAALLTADYQVFTGAHIVYSTPGMSKVDCIVDVCDELFKQREVYAQVATHQRSLEAVFGLLKEVDCVGGFMAYEMVTDMRHTRLLEDAQDIFTWANPGPGAKRGLHRLEMPYKPERKAIESMQMLQHRLQMALQIPFDGENDPVSAFRGSQIEMRDIEHSLCEFDKYCRVNFGEGEPRSKYPGGV